MEEQSIFKEKESKFGPIIGSLVIVVVIVVGGLYFLSQKVEERKLELKQQEQNAILNESVLNETDLIATSTEKTDETLEATSSKTESL